MVITVFKEERKLQGEVGSKKNRLKKGELGYKTRVE